MNTKAGFPQETLGRGRRGGGSGKKGRDCPTLPLREGEGSTWEITRRRTKFSPEGRRGGGKKDAEERAREGHLRKEKGYNFARSRHTESQK